jgi:hypothetical protein
LLMRMLLMMAARTCLQTSVGSITVIISTAMVIAIVTRKAVAIEEV